MAEGLCKVSVQAVIRKDGKMKTQFRLPSSTWIKPGKSNARRFIFKTQYSLGKSFQATVIPIPGAQ